MNWLMENKNWIFDGIGVALLMALLAGIWTLFKFIFFSQKKDSSSIKQTQKSGNKSINIQVGDNLIIKDDQKNERK